MSNLWDERYAGETFMYGTEPNDFLLAQASVIRPGGRVLCLAEGEGRNAVWLAERGFVVTGVDGSKVGLAKAQQLAAKRGVFITTVVDDLAHFDLGDACWDAVVSVWCHVPPPLRSSLHPRIVRALAPGGVLLLEHYHPRQVALGTGGPSDPALLLTLEMLRRDFSSLEELHGLETEREIREGHGHQGNSAVTQFLARRR